MATVDSINLYRGSDLAITDVSASEQSPVNGRHKVHGYAPHVHVHRSSHAVAWPHAVSNSLTPYHARINSPLNWVSIWPKTTFGCHITQNGLARLWLLTSLDGPNVDSTDRFNRCGMTGRGSQENASIILEDLYGRSGP
jgi:hypothetical protein